MTVHMAADIHSQRQPGNMRGIRFNIYGKGCHRSAKAARAKKRRAEKHAPHKDKGARRKKNPTGGTG